jgi:hypothetical protein
VEILDKVVVASMREMCTLNIARIADKMMRSWPDASGGTMAGRYSDELADPSRASVEIASMRFEQPNRIKNLSRTEHNSHRLVI